MSSLTAQECGIIGVVLYGLLSLITLQRSFAHVFPLRHPYFSTRKVFHLDILFYSLLQVLSFATFIVPSTQFYTKWSYSCHLFAVFCEISSFSLVAVLWSKTLLSARNAKRCIIPFLLLFDFIFFAYITTVVIDMCLSPADFFNWR